MVRQARWEQGAGVRVVGLPRQHCPDPDIKYLPLSAPSLTCILNIQSCCEHMSRKGAMMSDQIEVSTREMLKRMEAGWNSFQTYLNTLTDDQMTTLQDEVGWTVKDHLTHLALWEDGVAATLQGKSRPERMGIDQATLASHDYDKMNGIMRLQHLDKTLPQVRQMLADAHQRLVDAV